MSQSKTGGPTFPCVKSELVNDELMVPVRYDGMTLLDWWAGMAMQGMLANPDIEKMRNDDLTMLSYAIAESLLSRKQDLEGGD